MGHLYVPPGSWLEASQSPGSALLVGWHTLGMDIWKCRCVKQLGDHTDVKVGKVELRKLTV